MALINFMGGIGAAVEGYNDGARKQRADNKQQEVDAYDAKVREVNAAQLPLAAEAKRLQLENETADARNAAELRPLQQQTKKTEAQSAADLAPGKAEAEKNKQVLDAKLFAYKESEGVQAGRDNAEASQEKQRAKIGEYIAGKNIPAALAIIQQGYESPVVFPSLNGRSPPVSAVIGTAPAGALDVGGQPVTGQALVMTMKDGSTQYIAPSFFAEALRRKKEAEQQAAIKPVTAGTKLVNMKTGEEVFSNDNGLILDGKNADGSDRWIKPPGRGGEGKEVDPLSKTDKATLDSINRQRDKTQASILKGIADGADPKQMAAYAKIMAGLDIDERAMYAKYEGVKPGVADDKLGFRPSLQPGAAAPQPKAGPGVTPSLKPMGPTNKAEAGMASDVMGKDGYKAVSFEATPSNLQAIDAEIRRTQSPAAMQMLQEERAKIVVAIQAATTAATTGGVAPNAQPAVVASPAIAAPIRQPGGVTPTAAAPSQGINPASPESAGGRRSVSGVLSSTAVAAPMVPPPAVPVAAPIGKSPQTMGDDFESPLARAALTQRIQEARAGGAPLSRVEMLRARQLRLIA